MIFPITTTQGVRDTTLRNVRVPVLPSQRAMLAGHLSDASSSAWTVALLTRLRGRDSGTTVDVAALAQAIALTSAEMDTLRLRLDRSTVPPTQRVSADLGDAIRLIALAPGTAHEQEDEARTIAETICRAPWDRSPDAPLLTHTLLVGTHATWWLQRALHLVTDGFGGTIIRARVLTHYAALTAGHPAPQPSVASITDLPTEHTPAPASLAHWRTVLDGAPARLSPADRTAPVADQPHRHDVTLPTEVRTRLAAHLHGRLWTYPLVAAMGAFSARIAGEREAVVGLPVPGRHGPLAHQVPVTMMCVLPLRLTVEPGATLDSVLSQVAAATRAARPHRDVETEDLLRTAGHFRSGRVHGPVVNVLPFDEEPSAPGLDVSTEALERGPVYDLLWTARPSGDGSLALDCRSHRDLYTERQAETTTRRLALWVERASLPGVVLDEIDLRLPEEVTVTDALATPRTAGPPATARPRWGEPVDLGALTIPGLSAALPRGFLVVDALGHRLGLGADQVGELVAVREGERHPTGLLAHVEDDGTVVSHGEVMERRQVYGRYVEAGGVAASVAAGLGAPAIRGRWERDRLVLTVASSDDEAEGTGAAARAIARRSAPSGTKVRIEIGPS